MKAIPRLKDNNATTIISFSAIMLIVVAVLIITLMKAIKTRNNIKRTMVAAKESGAEASRGKLEGTLENPN